MLFIWTLVFTLVLQEQDFSVSTTCSKAKKREENGKGAAGDSISIPPGNSGRNDWCSQHNTIHKRLDAIEEQVEKTVTYLESEMKTLLKDISETGWSAPGTPRVDIFDDDS